MAALLNRSRRHSSFIQYDEDPMTCFLPDGLFTYEETCNFVTYHPSCCEGVFLINYLSYFVCFLGFDSNWEGDMAVVGFFFLLIMSLWTLIYILTKYFILPNILTVSRQLNMISFEFGLFVSLFLGIPDVVYVLNTCSRVPESSTLLFAEGIGKALGCFCIGTVLTSVKKPCRVAPWFFFLNVILMIAGILSMARLMESKYKHEHQPGNPPLFDYTWNAVAFAAVYFTYFGIVMLVLRWSQIMKSDDGSSSSSSSSDTPLPSYRTSEERDTYTDIFRAALGLNDMPAADTVVPLNTVTVTEGGPNAIRSPHVIVNTGASEPSPEPTKIAVLRVCLYSLFPFQHMRTYRWFQIVCAPFWFMLALFIPVIHRDRVLGGWCQPLVCFSFFMLPFYFLVIAPATTQVLLTMGGLGTVFVILIVMLTLPTKLPKCYALFVLPGLFASTIIFFVIDKEVDVILMQMLSYVNNWELDAIALIVYMFGYAVGEIIFCWELSKLGQHDVSLGITYGLTMFSIYATVPLMFLEPCPSPPNTAIMTASIQTGCVFVLLVLITMIIAFIFTNFELRFSLGIYTFFLFFLFLTFTSLAQTHQIHPYGAQHATRILIDHEPSTWT